ncbi:MAG: dihydropteroate synthase [Halanaerobiaceae bacterium]
MIIIGELINSTRDEIEKIIKERDEERLKEIAKSQEEAGADYIDVNAGTFVDGEPEHLSWLVKTVREVVEVPLSLDSPREEALQQAFELTGGKCIINSITAEENRYSSLLPLVQETEGGVIALCMDDDGMPGGVEDRLEIADKLMNRLIGDGIDEERIYLDPLVKPVSVDGDNGIQVVKSVHGISKWDTDVHITCGLSNVSYGLPARGLLNRAFLMFLMSAGLDSAILNPLDRELMDLIRAARVLLNRDAYGMEFLQAVRSGEIDN